MRSYSHLSEDERDQIGILRAAGQSMGAIARALGRAKTTISRELQRNALPTGGYSPLHAAGAYQLRRRRILERDSALRHAILFASVGGRKRPDRRFAGRGAVDGGHRPGAGAVTLSNVMGACAGDEGLRPAAEQDERSRVRRSQGGRRHRLVRHPAACPFAHRGSVGMGVVAEWRGRGIGFRPLDRRWTPPSGRGLLESNSRCAPTTPARSRSTTRLASCVRDSFGTRFSSTVNISTPSPWRLSAGHTSPPEATCRCPRLFSGLSSRTAALRRLQSSAVRQKSGRSATAWATERENLRLSRWLLT